MLQSISVVTLAVADLSVSNAFYRDGFGWVPLWNQPQITFYQMNGFILALYPADALAKDTTLECTPRSGGVTLAHNIADEDNVVFIVNRLLAAGGTLVRAPSAPPWGGQRAYVSDPDGHLWEIASTPGFQIAPDGRVTFVP